MGDWNSRIKIGQWDSRIQATNDISLMSLAQNRSCMLDKKNKGGKSLVMRCAAALKNHSPCRFYCKLRRDMKHQRWHITGEKEMRHTCEFFEDPIRMQAWGKTLNLRARHKAASNQSCKGPLSASSLKRNFEA